VVAFGVTLAIMNFAFYQGIARIPLGIAVTIEFLGPLAVAVASSRRLVDLAWVALAGAGVALLSDGWSSLSLHGGHGGTALAGVACALVAAAGWAAYILLSASTGRRFPGSSGLAIALVIAAVVVTPTAAVGAAGRGGPADQLRLAVLGTGVAAGLLSSVIPYRLEMEALRRIPARIFGIWMSLEPAIAALVGLLLLGQSLAPREWAAIGCVILACAGAARGDGSAPPAPDGPVPPSPG
jgi:inner membrane transporter RhtA